MFRRSLIKGFVIPSQVIQDLEDTLIPWMLTRSILLHLAKGKGHRVHWAVVSSAVELIFKETVIFTKPHTKATARNANTASHGSRVLAKERARKVSETENLKENPKLPHVPKVRTTEKPRTLVYVVLKFQKSDTSSETQESAQTNDSDFSYTDDSWFDDGWSCDEWNDDWSSGGWHERMTIPQAHFHWEVWILVQ